MPRARSKARTVARYSAIGAGISVQGTIAAAEKLTIEGTVESTLLQVGDLSISHGGLFKGTVEVEDAEISGML